MTGIKPNDSHDTQSSRPECTGNAYETLLLDSEVTSGDVVLVSSDVRHVALWFLHKGQIFDPKLLLDQIIELVGPAGTVLLPTYNWGFCEGKEFSIRDTPGLTGSLGNAALRHPAFRRSRHPFYSCAIAGADREELCSSMNMDAFGPDSFFAYLHHAHAKNLCLDVNIRNSCTFMHYVEQAHAESAPFRFMKEFTAPYVDEDGLRSTAKATMFVRDYDRDVRYDECKAHALMRDNGAVLAEYDACGTHVITYDMARMYLAFSEDLVHNAGRRYCTFVGQEEL